MLGIPQELNETFLDWSRAIAVFRGSPNRTVEHAQAAQDALIGLTEFFRKTVAERRRNKGNDLISLLIDIEEEGEVLTEGRAIRAVHCRCFSPGTETTRNLIRLNGMYTLLKHPQETAELRDNPDMIRTDRGGDSVVIESPVQLTARVLKEEIEVCGQRIPKGMDDAMQCWARRTAIQNDLGTESVEPEEAEQPAPGVQRGSHFCVRKPNSRD